MPASTSRAGSTLTWLKLCVWGRRQRRAVWSADRRQDAAALVPALVAPMPPTSRIVTFASAWTLELPRRHGVGSADGDMAIGRQWTGATKRLDVACCEAVDDVYLAGCIAAGVYRRRIALHVGNCSAQMPFSASIVVFGSNRPAP